MHGSVVIMGKNDVSQWWQSSASDNINKIPVCIVICLESTMVCGRKTCANGFGKCWTEAKQTKRENIETAKELQSHRAKKAKRFVYFGYCEQAIWVKQRERGGRESIENIRHQHIKTRLPEPRISALWIIRTTDSLFGSLKAWECEHKVYIYIVSLYIYFILYKEHIFHVQIVFCNPSFLHFEMHVSKYMVHAPSLLYTRTKPFAVWYNFSWRYQHKIIQHILNTTARHLIDQP